ncbi:hypothetical protein ACLKA6_010144 [Drosophila palustris]
MASDQVTIDELLDVQQDYQEAINKDAESLSKKTAKLDDGQRQQPSLDPKNTKVEDGQRQQPTVEPKVTALCRRQKAMIASLYRTLQQPMEHTAVELIRNLWTQIQDVHFRLYEEVEIPEENGYDIKEYLKAERDVQGALAAKSPSECTNDRNLPRITIPKFDGDILKWTQFLDMFVSMVHETNMPTIRKMWYLKTSVAINDNVKSLKELYIVTMESLASLKVLGIDISTWDPILIEVLRTNKTLYEQSISDSKHIQKLDTMLQFLDQRVRVLATGRLNWVQRQKLCVNCFKADHMAKACQSKYKCFKCDKKHNTLLHLEANSMEPKNPVVASASSKNISLLATAKVVVQGNNGQQATFKALLDSGSQINVISERLASSLFLKRHDTSLRIEGIALGPSLKTAERRFLSLEKRTKAEIWKGYVDFMAEYEKLGHMKIVPRNLIPSINYFIPHHCVLKPDSSTTKLRVVFDASCKTSTGKSLNDIRQVGPTVQSDLMSILLRFRTHKYVFTADIEKMYRQVWINPENQFHQMIIWRNNPNEDLRYYRLKTITYGTASAPFLATKCLNHLATIHMDKSPAGAAALMNDFYVDDCLTGADSAQEAIHIREELVKILRPNGFNLRKWCSNNDQLLHGIPKDDVASDVKFDDSLDSHRIKTLGLIWMPKKDQLCGRAQSSTALKITKRVVCSELAQIFDPLGLFAPVVVKAKIFMQRLWEDKLEHSNSFYKLQRIVAYMLRFCYKGYRATTTTVCTKELDRSRNLILRTIQQAEFSADLKTLQRYNMVDRKSSISSLSPVLGSDGLMRVGGRLEQAPLPYNAKHQILLPYNDPIVKMVLRELHEDNMHCEEMAKKRPINEAEDTGTTDAPIAQRKRLMSPTISSSMLILLLMLPLVLAQSVSVAKFDTKPGIYYEKIGQTMRAISDWTMVIYYDLDPYWRDMKTFNSGIIEFQYLCPEVNNKPTCDSISQHYRHLYDELQMANVLMQHTRKRRSPFDAVGNIANSLFGVLDSNYANEMTKVIKKVQTNEEFVLSLLKNQTSVLDSTINVVKKTRATSDKRLRLLEQQVAAIAESRGKYTG